MHLLVTVTGYASKHASRVLRSLGARNRSSSLLWLVHPITLATGTAWSDGRARNTSRELACRCQPAAEDCAAIESMKISMAAKRYSTLKDAAHQRLIKSR